MLDLLVVFDSRNLRSALFLLDYLPECLEVELHLPCFELICVACKKMLPYSHKSGSRCSLLQSCNTAYSSRIKRFSAVVVKLIQAFFFGRPFFALDGTELAASMPVAEVDISSARVVGIKTGTLSAVFSFLSSSSRAIFKTPMFLSNHCWKSFFCRKPCVLNHSVNLPVISSSCHVLPEGAA